MGRRRAATTAIVGERGGLEFLYDLHRLPQRGLLARLLFIDGACETTSGGPAPQTVHVPPAMPRRAMPTAVEVRLARQEILTREDRPQVWAVIGVAAALTFRALNPGDK